MLRGTKERNLRELQFVSFFVDGTTNILLSEKFSLRSMMQPFVHFVYNRWFKRASKRGNVSVVYVTINFILQQAGKIKLTRSLI